MKRVTLPKTKSQTEIDRFFRKIKDELNAKECANQAASTAADVATLKADFNTLLTSMKAAHLMDAD